MGNTKSIIEVVRKEINEIDPIGLISMGAPNDEYDPEVKEIVRKISQAGSIEKLQNLVYIRSQNTPPKIEYLGGDECASEYILPRHNYLLAHVNLKEYRGLSGLGSL